jgi:cellulose synthase/poly-beta-1,6-N-acetylglucosamine synthase-like glycosyltransferase
VPSVRPRRRPEPGAHARDHARRVEVEQSPPVAVEQAHPVETERSALVTVEQSSRPLVVIEQPPPEPVVEAPRPMPPLHAHRARREPHWRRAGIAAADRSRLIALLIVGGLFVFRCAKLEFRMPHSNDALYAYGVTVTAVVLLQMAFAILRYRDLAITDEPGDGHADGHADGADLPLVSCMLAVHNEEEIIEQCVRGIVAQSYSRQEVIVVDDASTDSTREVLKQLAAELPITVIELDVNVGKKRALGAAMQRAKGEIFAFTDSDSTWAPDAVSRVVRIFAGHSEVGAVSGHCRALNGRRNLLTKIQDSWYEGQFSVRKAFESVFGAVTCVSGPLAVFRREAIYNYIPAWEQDRFLGDEFRFATDRTLTGFVLMNRRKAERIKRRHADSEFLAVDYAWQPWHVVYCKSARSWTVVPETFRQLIKQQVRWKKSFLRNMWFTGGLYWRRAFLPALIYYLHVLFVIAGPFVAFRHLIYMPLHGNVESMLLYLFGIALIGSMFGLAFRREEPSSTSWVYRPLMSLLSTVVLSWLVFYSLLTIKKMNWSRG